MADSDLVRCPRCRTENRPDRALCYVCGMSLVGAEPVVTPARAPRTRETGRPSFRLGSLMLLIALVGVMLGIWRKAPGLAILLMIPSAIALWSTIDASRRSRDRPRTTLEHVLVFLTSFLLVVIVGISSAAAFFVTCLAVVSTGRGDYGGDMLGPGLLLGLLVGVGVMVALIVAILRAKKRRRDRSKPPSETEP